MPVFHEILPETYLLIPTDTASEDGDELLQALRRARHSGKPSITLDCRHLSAISPAIAHELVRLQNKWRKHHIKLLVAQATDVIRQAFPHHAMATILSSSSVQSSNQEAGTSHNSRHS